MFRALIVILGIASLVSGLFITESAQGGVIKVLIASTGTPSGATTALQNAMNTRFGSANVTTCNPSASIPSLTGINVVILNTNMASNEQAIVAGGETTLVNFVKAGGGLVTGEWLNWNIGRNATLQTILPTSGTNTSYTTATSIKYTKTATDDPFMNAGLPGNFTFTALSNGGTGVPLAPLAGAPTQRPSWAGWFVSAPCSPPPPRNWATPTTRRCSATPSTGRPAALVRNRLRSH